MNLQEIRCWRGICGCGLGQEEVAVSCGHGNEPSGSIKCGEFLD
jgi:hypothetical protein